MKHNRVGSMGGIPVRVGGVKPNYPLARSADTAGIQENLGDINTELRRYGRDTGELGRH